MTDKDVEKLLELKKLENRDKFRFKCNGCGECCKHREDILLPPYDIFRICRFLKVDFDDFIGTYCELYVGPSSKLPVVRLRTSALCVFLMHGKCLIHEAKPSVCVLYPLGRMTDFRAESREMKYFLQDIRCGTKDQENVVEDWLRPLGDEHEECVHIWHSMIKELTILTQNMQGNDDAMMEKFTMAVFELLYNGYNHGEVFLPQFKKRGQAVKEFCKACKDIAELHQQ